MNRTLNTLLTGLVTGCIACFFATSQLSAQSSGYGAEEGGSGESVSFDDGGYGGDESDLGEAPQEENRKARSGGGGASGMGMGMGSGRGKQSGGSQGFGAGGGLGAGGFGGGGADFGGESDDMQDDGGMGMGMGAGMSGMGGLGRRSPQKVKLILQTYSVGELLSQSVDQPFDGFVLPGLGSQNNLSINRRGNGGGFGGGTSGGGFFAMPVPLRVQLGGGGMGGMGGMGMDEFEDDYGGGESRSYSTNSNSVSMSDLMRAIVSSVSSSSWEARGGPGAISNLGEVLIVNQTEEVHQQISLFLDMLGKTGQRKSTVTIKAIWLTINEEQFQSLDIERDQQVNSKVLAQLVKTNGQRSQVTCFDRQTVHIAAGNLRSTIESVVPVVGQIDSNGSVQSMVARSETRRSKSTPSHVMAQVGGMGLTSGNDSATSRRSVGYQPISRWINYGAVLQLKPKVDADGKMMTLSVSSVLVNSGDSTTEPLEQIVMGEIGLDSHSVRCQQFQSNVRLKDSTPTLVGGAAFQSKNAEDQTYLIIEAIVNYD